MTTIVTIELRKFVVGRATAITLLAGAAMCLLGSYGSLITAQEADLKGLADGGLTASMVQAWMMMLLFTAILGVLSVTREVSAQTLGRTVLAFGGRTSVFVAKAAAGLVMGLLVGGATAAAATATTAGLLRRGGYELMWTQEATWTLLGVVASIVLATLWGQALGWIIRAQTAAVLVVVLLVVVLEPAVQHLAPGASKFLFTIALSSLYGDKKPELLDVWPATIVALAWVGTLALGAHHTLRARDV